MKLEKILRVLMLVGLIVSAGVTWCQSARIRELERMIGAVIEQATKPGEEKR